MIGRLGELLTRVTRRWLPDPFIIALGLLFVTAIAGAVHASPATVVDAFGPGFAELLKFAMQMCLVLVSGFALADSPPVRRALRALASIPQTTSGAAAMIAACAMATALFNWGLGLIVGAFLAREVGRSARARGVAMHYPMLAAAGYTGLMVWHGGFSGSAPLDVAKSIPLTQTVLAPLNLALTGSVFVAVVILFRFMKPPREVQEADVPPEPAPPAPEPTPAAAIERSILVTLAFAGLAGGFLVRGLLRDGGRFINLDTVTLLFLALGMLLHLRPISFAASIYDGAKACGGIILQFPIYGAIAAILTQTGLLDLLIRVQPADPIAFKLVTFLVACGLNLFIPSGGGQWKVQGPIVMGGAAQAGVDPGTGVMLVAYGDELTNMIQPFWALPLLGVTGLRARDMIGYSAAVMLAVFPIYAFWLCVLG